MSFNLSSLCAQGDFHVTEPHAEHETNTTSQKQPQATLEERQIQTHHRVVIDGQPIDYTATAGTYVLKDKEGRAEAAIFFVAYTRDPMTDPATRPVTFAFNGGPGSSSVWLHLGMLGPRKVHLEEFGRVAPPYQLEDNLHSLLDVTDLVFIDPVSTGFSKPAAGEKEEAFHGYKKDIEIIGEFIRLYVTRNGRWRSPKFLIGESYGTTRGSGLIAHMMDNHGMAFNGLMLISVVLNFQTLQFVPGNDLPFLLYLPTYAATAWYHHRLPDELQTLPLTEVLAQAEAFVEQAYLPGLFRGDALPHAERLALASELSRFTGMAPDYILQSNLRIEIYRFTKALLRDQRRTIGRLDSRYTGIDRDAAGEKFEYDPSFPQLSSLFTALFNDYVRRELGFEMDEKYHILARLYEKWDFAADNRFLDVSDDLRKTISQNPQLQVFIANGYFDLATPYYATIYTINHLGLEPELRENIQATWYEAGHMMYTHPPSLAKLRSHLTHFITRAAS